MNWIDKEFYKIMMVDSTQSHKHVLTKDENEEIPDNIKHAKTIIKKRRSIEIASTKSIS